jgi:hypothetical protein
LSPRVSASWLANWALVPPGWPGTGSGMMNADALGSPAMISMLLPGPCR